MKWASAIGQNNCFEAIGLAPVFIWGLVRHWLRSNSFLLRAFETQDQGNLIICFFEIGNTKFFSRSRESARHKSTPSGSVLHKLGWTEGEPPENKDFLS
ncbi:MAG: hypothetical protein PSN37_01770 [Alphaproteobacteria bacterium]|nr:hypothetical protein [Alphaproteobacteria bacterium]